MKEFKNYFEEHVTVGLTEYIEIDGIGKVKAKIDSGNEGYNVLHGINVTNIAENKVKFQTIDNKTVSFVKKGEIQIHAGKSNELRPVISLNIKLGDQFYQDVPFSISDRTNNDEPVLIGEVFLKKINALIDVNKEQLQENQAERGPLVSDRFVSISDKIAALKKEEQRLVLILNDEWNDKTSIQNEKYLEAQRDLRKVKEKLMSLTPASSEFGAEAFKAFREKLK